MSKELASKIRGLRKTKRVTQSELAEYLEVSRSAVANWEKGIRRPGLRHMKYIAEYFDVPYDEIVESAFTVTRSQKIV